MLEHREDEEEEGEERTIGRNQVDGHGGGAAFEKNHEGLDQVVSRVEIGPWPILHPRNATSDGVLTMRYVGPSPLLIHEHLAREMTR